MKCGGGVTVRTGSALLLVLLFGLSSCSTFSHMGDPGQDELERSVDAFNKYLRWKQYAKAKLFVLPNRERAFLRFAQRVESNLDINEFSTDDVTIDKSDDTAGLRTEARVQIRLEYTRLPSNVYHKVLLEQVWLIQDGQWMLEFPQEGWDL
jgi:hypothetical protein